MLPVLQPAQLGRELAVCTILGAAVGVVRAFFPVRGRGAFVPDALLTGAVLFGVQSYAAALSSAGVLRWYMVLAAFAAALCTAAVLGIPVRWAGRCLAWVLGVPVRLARQWVLRPLAVRHAARKERRNAKRPGVEVMTTTVGGGYAAFTGTSFATPFVTGSAALLMEWGIVRGNDPYLYGEKVKAYLRRGAKKVPGFDEYPNEEVGYGEDVIIRLH